MTWTFEETEAGYTNLWKSCTIAPQHRAEAIKIAEEKIIANEIHYKSVQASTGVPWWWVGITHLREADCNLKGCLANGDMIIGTGEKTRSVPAGRGPYATFEESAVDEIKMMGLQRVQSWSPARACWAWETFNGTGYVSKGENSPYVWAWTNNQQPGKFTGDHQFSATTVDTQPGCAAILLALAELRPDVEATLQPAAPPVAPPIPVPVPPPAPVAPPPAPPVPSPPPAAVEPTWMPVLKVLAPIIVEKIGEWANKNPSQVVSALTAVGVWAIAAALWYSALHLTH